MSAAKRLHWARCQGCQTGQPHGILITSQGGPKGTLATGQL